METARDERMVRNSTEREAWRKVRSGVERIRFFLRTKSPAGINTALPASKMGYYADFKGGGAFVRSIVRLIILIAFKTG